MERIEDLWPLFRLRLRTGDLELRVPSDADVAEVAALTREPIHDPARMPFFVPWTDEPEDVRARATLQWHWRSRAEWKPEDWRFEMVAVRAGIVVGTQGMNGRRFAVTREVETGSWVGRRYQGQGIGTAMRRAVLHLAFAGLGASSARSGAFSDNAASLRVSERLGYRPDGSETRERRGEPATLVRLLLTRPEWERLAPSWPSVTVEGLEACRAEFGLGPERPDALPSGP
jgi:RimJ/RimL family protein N-acetyltransferase